MKKYFIISICFIILLGVSFIIPIKSEIRRESGGFYVVIYKDYYNLYGIRIREEQIDFINDAMPLH